MNFRYHHLKALNGFLLVVSHILFLSMTKRSVGHPAWAGCIRSSSVGLEDANRARGLQEAGVAGAEAKGGKIWRLIFYVHRLNLYMAAYLLFLVDHLLSLLELL